MKKIPSIIAAFTLAAACLIGARPAEARVERLPIPATQYMDYDRDECVLHIRQNVLDDFSWRYGASELYCLHAQVQEEYPLAHKGFSTVHPHLGQRFGLEYDIGRGYAEVVAVYDLNNGWDRDQYQYARQEARELQASLERNRYDRRDIWVDPPRYSGGSYYEPPLGYSHSGHSGTGALLGFGAGFLAHELIEHHHDNHHNDRDRHGDSCAPPVRSPHGHRR